ncbi:hypothetical protein HK100_012895 [Physocladia obscura]|uniref:Uncharacterized protein n=1 Tax=Physocladia obscura TaxID=109957 RepID=A0AAD5SZ25_9FUNG|nr:hypothetical protein HK100_012895 [Physocladia obscura]
MNQNQSNETTASNSPFLPQPVPNTAADHRANLDSSSSSSSSGSTANSSIPSIARATSATATVTVPTLPPPHIIGRLSAAAVSPLDPPLHLLSVPSPTASTSATATANNAIADRSYPLLLSPDVAVTQAQNLSRLLLTPDGTLKPAMERDRVFEALEAKISLLRAKSADIVKCTRALQRACAATSLSAASSASPYSSSSISDGPSIHFGGVKKPRSANASGLVSLAAQTSARDKLRDELIKIVTESRELRASQAQELI